MNKDLREYYRWTVKNFMRSWSCCGSDEASRDLQQLVMTADLEAISSDAKETARIGRLLIGDDGEDVGLRSYLSCMAANLQVSTPGVLGAPSFPELCEIMVATRIDENLCSKVGQAFLKRVMSLGQYNLAMSKKMQERPNCLMACVDLLTCKVG